MVSKLHGTITTAGKLTHDKYRRPVVLFTFKPDKGHPIECRYRPDGSVFNALTVVSSGRRVRLALSSSGRVDGLWLHPEPPTGPNTVKAPSEQAAAILATL